MKNDLIKGMPFVLYREIKAESASRLKRMLVSPLHYRHAATTESPDTEALRVGRATHTSILEPDRFALDFTVYTLSKTVGEGSRKAWQAFKEANAHRTILDEGDYETALAMRNAVHRHRLARELLIDGDAEVTLTWDHPTLRVPCKGRLDYLGPRGIVEVKTASRIEIDAFARQVAAYAYHLQCGWYAAGYEAVTGSTLPYHMICVEKTAPHDVVVYRVPQALLESARVTSDELLERVLACEAADEWPGVGGDETVDLALPEWATRGGEEDVVLDLGGGDFVAV